MKERVVMQQISGNYYLKTNDNSLVNTEELAGNVSDDASIYTSENYLGYYDSADLNPPPPTNLSKQRMTLMF